MRSVLILLTMLAVSCKQSKPHRVPVEAEPAVDSKFFSVMVPSGYSSSVFNMGDDSKVFPALNLEPDSGDKKTQVGSLVVFHNSKYAGMMLRDGVGAEVKFYSERAGRLLIPPHQIPSKNGTCIGFVIADPGKDCPENVKAATCFSIGYAGQCESPFGKRFSVMGIVAIQPSNAKLEPSAVEMAKTFDRIMATLEFKKF